MSVLTPQPLVINGWTLYLHPNFESQVDLLRLKVESLKRKDPKGFKNENTTKRLAAIYKLVFDVIPQDPTRSEYRQGDTLGEAYTHWFRAKFFQQYRLFFRYHADAKIIVFAWVNDEDSKRAYESDDDAYKTFRKMLRSGDPSDAWEKLLSASDPAAAVPNGP